MLPAVQPRVVDAHGGAGGQFRAEGGVALAEGLASLGAGELNQPQHPAARDHRHGQGGLHQGARGALDAGGAEGVGVGGAGGIAVDAAEFDGFGVGCAGGAPAEGDGPVGDGAGEGHAPQRAGSVQALSGPGVLPGEHLGEQVHGGQVAELGHGDVEQFAGGGVQVERVAYPGSRRVQQGQGPADVVRLSRLGWNVAQRRPFLSRSDAPGPSRPDTPVPFTARPRLFSTELRASPVPPSLLTRRSRLEPHATAVRPADRPGGEGLPGAGTRGVAHFSGVLDTASRRR